MDRQVFKGSLYGPTIPVELSYFLGEDALWQLGQDVDFLEPRIQAIWIEESFHDPTGHNRHWTGFDERVENRWKHSGYPAGQMDSPIVCSDRNHLSCPDLFHRLCAVQLDLIVGGGVDHQ